MANMLTAGRTTFSSAPTGGLIKGSMTISSLARHISNRLKVPVEDRTGLSATYDIDLRWQSDSPLEGGVAASASERNGTDDAASPMSVDLFETVRNALGLRIEPAAA